MYFLEIPSLHDVSYHIQSFEKFKNHFEISVTVRGD